MSSRVPITETEEMCETGLCMRAVEFVELDDPRGPEDEEDEEE